MNNIKLLLTGNIIGNRIQSLHMTGWEYHKNPFEMIQSIIKSHDLSMCGLKHSCILSTNEDKLLYIDGIDSGYTKEFLNHVVESGFRGILTTNQSTTTISPELSKSIFSFLGECGIANFGPIYENRTIRSTSVSKTYKINGIPILINSVNFIDRIQLSETSYDDMNDGIDYISNEMEFEHRCKYIANKNPNGLRILAISHIENSKHSMLESTTHNLHVLWNRDLNVSDYGGVSIMDNETINIQALGNLIDDDSQNISGLLSLEYNQTVDDNIQLEAASVTLVSSVSIKGTGKSNDTLIVPTKQLVDLYKNSHRHVSLFECNYQQLTSKYDMICDIQQKLDNRIFIE